MASLSKRRICDHCHQIVIGPCPTCSPQRRAEADQARGTSAQRGYGSHWRNVIRPAFLRDNPLCVICGGLAEVPDHWPETRATLLARGVTDPDAAHRMRPLCLVCHARYGMRGKGV